MMFSTVSIELTTMGCNPDAYWSVVYSQTKSNASAPVSVFTEIYSDKHNIWWRESIRTVTSHLQPLENNKLTLQFIIWFEYKAI